MDSVSKAIKNSFKKPPFIPTGLGTTYTEVAPTILGEPKTPLERLKKILHKNKERFLKLQHWVQLLKYQMNCSGH
ncbi:MAG: hypothetical protein LVR00_05900 [Rhabdochlamydiaceae bacterium]|jgi:hypothetical protein